MKNVKVAPPYEPNERQINLCVNDTERTFIIDEETLWALVDDVKTATAAENRERIKYMVDYAGNGDFSQMLETVRRHIGLLQFINQPFFNQSNIIV